MTAALRHGLTRSPQLGTLSSVQHVENVGACMVSRRIDFSIDSSKQVTVPDRVDVSRGDIVTWTLENIAIPAAGTAWSLRFRNPNVVSGAGGLFPATGRRTQISLAVRTDAPDGEHKYSVVLVDASQTVFHEEDPYLVIRGSPW